MARNEEKAKSMLHRFREAEMVERTGMTAAMLAGVRPPHTRMVATLTDAERWRSSVTRDITVKVSRIHDPQLNEAQIRDLNDDINKLFKEKWQWEKRVAELGGPDYTRLNDMPKLVDGKEIPGMRGYKYFGRARELPDVKELLEKIEIASGSGKSKKRTLNRSKFDAQYYGYLEDKELEKNEKLIEADLTAKYNAKIAFSEKSSAETDSLDPIAEALYAACNEDILDFLPNSEDIEKWMLDLRKKELLQKYSLH